MLFRCSAIFLNDNKSSICKLALSLGPPEPRGKRAAGTLNSLKHREIGCGGSLSRRHHRPKLGCLAAGKSETPPRRHLTPFQREDAIDDLRSPHLHPPNRSCPPGRGAPPEAPGGAPQAFEARCLLAHRVRTVEPSHPRLPL